MKPDNQEDNRYSIPDNFNPTQYCVYRAVRGLLDRDDIPPVYLPLKNRFIHYFTKILHFGTDYQNLVEDNLKNDHLTKICGKILDEDLDPNLNANSDFLKLALNILRDYIDSISKIKGKDDFNIFQLNDIVRIIEKYFNHLIDPNSEIE